MSIIPVPLFSTINVGVSVKEVTGESFYLKTVLNKLTDGDEIVEDLKEEFNENRKTTHQMSMDAGVSVNPIPGLNIGVGARNLIPMEFDSAGPEKIEIGPQLRGGASYSLGGIVKVGFDVDLLQTDLDQFVSDLKSRNIALGTEVSLGFFKLRGGFFDNVASAESKGTFTGGVGLNLFGLHLDVNGQYAPSDVKIELASPLNGSEEQTVPERLGLGVSLGLDLGF